MGQLLAFTGRPAKGRIRRSQSMQSCGDCALLQIDRAELDRPANVVSMKERSAAAIEVPKQLAVETLALVMFATLPADHKQRVREALAMGRHGSDVSMACFAAAQALVAPKGGA